MKRAKVCALLCVAALSVNPVLPAMAAESTVESTEASETTVDEETGNEQEAANEAESPVPAENADQVAGQEATEQQNPAAVEPSTQEAIPQNGWYTDDDGNTYYYENGEMVCDQIKEFEEDGVVYGYYFDVYGRLMKNGEAWTTNNDVYGCVKADASGHLYTGWDDDQYYGEDYIRYEYKILDEDGVLYYFGEYGYLVTDDTIMVDGVLYTADENGVLTKETVESTKWVSANGNWYYYEDGQMVKDDYRVIKGVEYHFDYEGQMSTEAFWDDGEWRLAEPDGRIVRHAVGWYYSQQTAKWYYFKSTDCIVSSERIQINGKEYAFNWEGEMQTGSFYYDGEWVYADASGVIVTTDGWQSLNGNWYYIQNGKLVRDTVLDIKNATYIFDGDGQMMTGKISRWNSETGTEKYVTNASGAIVKNGWVRSDLAWVYAGADGKLLTSQWKGGYYLTEDGSMAIGEVTIDGKDYVFDENGHQEGIVGSKTGWQKYDGQWYYYTEDGEPYDGWLNNTWYIANGKMETNSLVPSQKDRELYSYVGPQGTIQNGWIKLDYQWIYSVNNQVIQDDWYKIGGVWYYFDYVNMVSNCIREIDGKLYQFDASGRDLGQIKKAGWVRTGSSWYYINDDLTVNRETIKKIGNKTYYFEDYNGALITNDVFIEGYYNKYIAWIDANGNLDTTNGWKKTSYGEWYYQENGKLVRGEKVINGRRYRFSEYSGQLMWGFRTEAGVRIFTDMNGNETRLTSGWYHLNQHGYTSWYYFVNGKPAEGWLNGYYFSFDGRMSDGITWENNVMYAFDSNGHLRKNQWFVENGNWYYAGSTGRVYTGERKIGNKTYWFNEYGVWVK